MAIINLPSLINLSIRKNYKVAIKVSKDKKQYHSYNQRITRIFNDIKYDTIPKLCSDISCNVNECRLNFPEEDIFLSVTTSEGTTIDHLLFKKCVP